MCGFDGGAAGVGVGLMVWVVVDLLLLAWVFRLWGKKRKKIIIVFIIF